MSNLKTPRGPASNTFRLTPQGSKKKKLEYQLVLRASSSNILLTRGHLLLVLVHDFIRGRLARTLSKLETLLAQQEIVVPDYSLLDGTIFEPCTFLLALLEGTHKNRSNLLQKPRALTICEETR